MSIEFLEKLSNAVRIDFLVSKTRPTNYLRILRQKQHLQIRLQRLRKVWTWTLVSLVHQINSTASKVSQYWVFLVRIFQPNTGKYAPEKTPYLDTFHAVLFIRGSENETRFSKNKAVTGKTLFFAIGPFCIHHSICFNIGFWCGSFVWKWCIFNQKNSPYY